MFGGIDPRLGACEIVAAVGFGSAHALRHHFRKKVGLTPTEYRSRFIKVERGVGKVRPASV